MYFTLSPSLFQVLHVQLKICFRWLQNNSELPIREQVKLMDMVYESWFDTVENTLNGGTAHFREKLNEVTISVKQMP